MNPSEIDFNSLGFALTKTKSILISVYKNGSWSAPELRSSSHALELELFSSCLNYGQACFEGLKAFNQRDGKIRIFRPDLNAQRLAKSCRAVSMPVVPEKMFLDAVEMVVRDNKDYVPPLESQGSLYIRPLVIGSGAVIGLEPAKEYLFLIGVVPVGEYYKSGMVGVDALIMAGASPNGCGGVKVAGNYAPCLGPTDVAKSKGYTITLFLDPREGRFVEEFATSNFVGLKKQDSKITYVTPLSPSILPSITNKSLSQLAAKFGWAVERRQVLWDELLNGEFAEVAAVGTAVVITPIKKIVREIKEVTTPSIKSDIKTLWEDDLDDGKVNLQTVNCESQFEGMKILYDAYRDIQREGKDEYGWMYPAEGI